MAVAAVLVTAWAGAWCRRPPGCRRAGLRRAAGGEPVRAGRQVLCDGDGARRGGELPAGAPDHRARPQARLAAGYWACLTGVGLLNFFGLLLIAAHAVTVLVACLREGDRRARRSLTLGWLAAAAGAVLVTSPVVLLAWTERSQLAWLNAPRTTTVGGLEQLAGSGQMPVGLAIILVGGVLASALSGRAALRRGWPALLRTGRPGWPSRRCCCSGRRC